MTSSCQISPGHQLSDFLLGNFVQCSEVFVGAVDVAAGHRVLKIVAAPRIGDPQCLRLHRVGIFWAPN